MSPATLSSNLCTPTLVNPPLESLTSDTGDSPSQADDRAQSVCSAMLWAQQSEIIFSLVRSGFTCS